MKRFLKICAMLAPAAVLFAFVRMDRHERYRPGDWVSYGVSRFIHTVAVGPEYAYFGSNAGVLRYDAIRNRWLAPYTTSDGLASNVITTVGFDPNTSFLWCATEAGVSAQHPSSLRWMNYSKADIGIAGDEEVLSIGFTSEANWFETRTQLFRQDKFGNVFLLVREDIPSNIVWFGLRREPQPNPVPQFFMPGGYLFEPPSLALPSAPRRASASCTWAKKLHPSEFRPASSATASTKSVPAGSSSSSTSNSASSVPVSRVAQVSKFRGRFTR